MEEEQLFSSRASVPEMVLFFKLFIKITRDEKVVSGGESSLVGNHEIQEHCCLFCWGPGISDLTAPRVCPMEQMPQKGSQGGRVDGREAAKGLTPILEGLQCLKERRKSVWKKISEPRLVG